ncbi:MAG: efflux RND transporter periplasmic adaptor subunit [Phocaeicola dorei]|nr:efflux RND transporter periplasmic adaptor subunit [Phocaeicola dorei]
MKNRFLLFGMIGLCVLESFFLSSCADNRKAEDRNVYATQVLAPQSRSLTTVYSATIAGKQDVEIYPQVAGTLTGVYVEEGSMVRKGQTLFVIDQVPYRAALNTARANVRAAKAGVENARLMYDSRKELFAEKVISEFDLKTAANALETAEAQLAQRQAEEDRAANDFSYTEVKSPSNGVVGVLPYRVGALVSANSPRPLTTVSDNSEMFAYFSMSENRLLALTQQYGDMQKALAAMPAVELQLSNGSVFPAKGEIRSISGVIDRTTGSVILKAVFPNEGRLLHSGATGNVLMPSVYENRIVIPQTATYELQDKRFAYKVVDGKAVGVQITVSSINDGKEFIVEEGLAAGDVIVTEGVGTLRSGMAVATGKEEAQ